LPKPPVGRWIMVGRLDYNTSGLLLFTNDGELANQLMHPSFHLTRVYEVRLYGTISDAMLIRLKRGVELEDGIAYFEQIKWLSGEGKNHWYEVSVAMGKNRIVRRLWESQEIKVNRLVRVAFGPIELPDSLQPGKYCILKQDEIAQFNIKELC
jgi:23S rRNA pseudouridine2605 synthase